jgi:hypothetical protein
MSKSLRLLSCSSRVADGMCFCDVSDRCCRGRTGAVPNFPLGGRSERLYECWGIDTTHSSFRLSIFVLLDWPGSTTASRRFLAVHVVVVETGDDETGTVEKV